MRGLRAAALVIVGVVMGQAVHIGAQQTRDTSPAPSPITDPLAKELQRCKDLHEQAATDENCRTAYTESRRRFLEPPGDYQPSKIDLYPSVPDPKAPKPAQNDITGQ